MQRREKQHKTKRKLLITSSMRSRKKR